MSELIHRETGNGKLLLSILEDCRFEAYNELRSSIEPKELFQAQAKLDLLDDLEQRMLK